LFNSFSLSARAIHNLAKHWFEGMTGASRIFFGHVGHEAVCLMMRYQINRGTSKTAAGEPRTEAARGFAGELDQRV